MRAWFEDSSVCQFATNGALQAVCNQRMGLSFCGPAKRLWLSFGFPLTATKKGGARKTGRTCDECNAVPNFSLLNRMCTLRQVGTG